MYDALPHTPETRIPSLLEVKNYLNHYFAMYTCLTTLPYTGETRIPTYLG